MRSLILMLLAIVLPVGNPSISLAADPVENWPEMPAYIPEYGQINATQTVLSNTTIGANLSSLSFILTWFDAASSLEATLTSPNGTKIDSTAKMPIIYGINKSMIFYILPDPQAGKWTATITGKNVPVEGVSYLSLFYSVPADESTEQSIIDENMGRNDPEYISGECKKCAEQS
jgi:hypothetical protein